MEKISIGQLVMLIIYLIMDTEVNLVASDYTYTSDFDEITLALINVSYLDTHSGRIRNQREDIGKFSLGKIGSVTGLVVHLESVESCETIEQRLWPSETWILLMASGTCTDLQKIRNAANTNASAVVIYDSKPPSKFTRFGYKVVDLISVFISKEKGEEIRWLTKNGTRVFLHITVGTHNAFRYANINKTSVLFVSVSFAILMIISLAWLIFYYIQRFRYIHAKDLLARRLGAEAKIALSKVPTKTIRSTDLQNAQQGDFVECCAVCIEMFKIGDLVRILPCKHVFHKGCVDPWLLEQRSCPMCKLDILKHYGLIGESMSHESVFNIEEPYIYQQPWRSMRNRRGSDDIEIVHVPINNHNSRQTSRNLNNRSIVTVNNETQTTSTAVATTNTSTPATTPVHVESQSSDEIGNSGLNLTKVTVSLEKNNIDSETQDSSPSRSSYKSCELYSSVEETEANKEKE